jgi:hypothetical protein
MKKVACLFMALMMSLLAVSCKSLTNGKRDTLKIAKMDSTSSDIRYASNIYVALYNENFPLSENKSIIIAPKKFPQKYIGDYIEKNGDIKFIVAKDEYNRIGSNGEYVSKIIFADDRLPQIEGTPLGGIIETFYSSDDAIAHIEALKKEIKNNYVYQNGVDLLALSGNLSPKQVKKYQVAFMQLSIENSLNDSQVGNIV